MGVVFTQASINIDDKELLSCAEMALKSLQNIFHLPKFPSATSIFETTVRELKLLATPLLATPLPFLLTFSIPFPVPL